MEKKIFSNSAADIVDRDGRLYLQMEDGGHVNCLQEFEITWEEAIQAAKSSQAMSKVIRALIKRGVPSRVVRVLG